MFLKNIRLQKQCKEQRSSTLEHVEQYSGGSWTQQTKCIVACFSSVPPKMFFARPSFSHAAVDRQTFIFFFARAVSPATLETEPEDSSWVPVVIQVTLKWLLYA